METKNKVTKNQAVKAFNASWKVCSKKLPATFNNANKAKQWDIFTADLMFNGQIQCSQFDHWQNPYQNKL